MDWKECKPMRERKREKEGEERPVKEVRRKEKQRKRRQRKKGEKDQIKEERKREKEVNKKRKNLY